MNCKTTIPLTGGIVTPEETDQIYCEQCEHFVGYERTPEGDRIILCARCSGECAFCHCSLGEDCFASLKVKFVPPHPHKSCDDGGTR